MLKLQPKEDITRRNRLMNDNELVQSCCLRCFLGEYVNGDIAGFCFYYLITFMMNNNQQQSSEEQLSGKELYEMKKKERSKARGSEVRTETLKGTSKKIGPYIFYAVVGIAVLGGLVWFFLKAPLLPPTSDANHIEQSPPAHIVTTPIPDKIQRHMLEHADGRGDPSVIIQYNCGDYSCAPDLIEKLTNLVGQYPDNVYLAPNKYDGKIILTRLGRRVILDGFDEEVIKDFIE